MPDEVKRLQKRDLIAAIPEVEILNAMPPTMRSIADASSPAAALALAAEHGGRRFHFPREAGPGTQLVRLIGAGAAKRLVAEFGGVYVEMPTARFLTKLMVQHSAAPAVRLSEVLGITTRYVRMIRAEQRRAAKALRMPAGAREGRGAIPLPENR